MQKKVAAGLKTKRRTMVSIKLDPNVSPDQFISELSKLGFVFPIKFESNGQKISTQAVVLLGRNGKPMEVAGLEEILKKDLPGLGLLNLRGSEAVMAALKEHYPEIEKLEDANFWTGEEMASLKYDHHADPAIYDFSAIREKLEHYHFFCFRSLGNGKWMGGYPVQKNERFIVVLAVLPN